jgi:hypothetical protein
VVVLYRARVGKHPSLRPQSTYNLRDTIRVNATLELGATTETVEVHEEVVDLQTDNATVSQVVDSEQVEDLSVNGRNYLSLAQIVTGASGHRVARSSSYGVATLLMR